MTDSARRGRRNRQRGQEGEREVAALINETLGLEIARNLGQERDGGADLTLDGLRVEVKRRKPPGAFYGFLADKDVVFYRADSREWLVTVRAKDWLHLYGMLRRSVDETIKNTNGNDSQ